MYLCLPHDLPRQQADIAHHFHLERQLQHLSRILASLVPASASCCAFLFFAAHDYDDDDDDCDDLPIEPSTDIALGLSRPFARDRFQASRGNNTRALAFCRPA